MATGSGNSSKDGEDSKILIPTSRRSNKPTTSTPSDRLPSLKPKRDLTLGGVPKKVFTPTIPARRTKKPNVVKSKDPPSVSSTRPEKRQKERQDRSDKNRRKEVIASASVFSMGPAEKMIHSQRECSTFGGMYSDQSSKRKNDKFDKSVSETKKDIHPISSEEEMIMDITSTAGKDLFSSSLIPPIQLPLDSSLHSETIKELTVQPQPLITVKSEPQSDEVMEVDTSKEPVKPVKPVTKPVTQPHQITVSQLFTPSEDSKGKFLFFQLPDCLPLPSPKESKMETETVSVKKENLEEGKEEEIHLPSLRDVPEGLIGKLRIYQSGNVKLVLGDTALDVAMGTRGGFLQELSCVRTSDNPSITILGQLSHRLVCTPDLTSMLDDER